MGNNYSGPGLFGKFLAVTAAAALGPILVLGGSLYSLADRTLRASTADYYLAVTDDVSLLLDRELDGAGDALGRITAALEDTDLPVKKRLSAVTSEMARANCDPFLLIYSPGGEYLDMLGPPGAVFPFPGPGRLPPEAMDADGGARFGGIVYPAGGGFPRLRITHRWKGGYAEVYYDLQSVSAYLADISSRRFRSPGVLSLVSSAGTVLGHANMAAVLEKRAIAGLPAPAPAGPAAASMLVSGVPAYSVVSQGRDASGRYLAFYAPLPRYGMGVAIREREEDVLRALFQTRRLVLLWSAAAALLAAALAFSLSRGLRARLGALMTGIREMSASRVPGLQVSVPGRDEIGDLAASFNRMSAELAARMKEIIEVRHEEEKIKRTRDEALEVARFKSEFMAAMSHEIRTPIQAVIGYSELLGRAGLSPAQTELLEPVRHSADGLLAIINNILDYSKAEAGAIELEAVEFSPREALERVARTMASAADAKGLELVVFTRPGVPWRVTGDQARLEQVLLNLTGNAVKFTARGRVALRAAPAGPAAADRAAVEFSVSDTGMGFSPPEKERLFKAFSQATRGIARKYGGTGLGLVLSRKLANLMGGELDASGQPGQGAVFTLKIEFLVAAAESPEGRPLAGARFLVEAADAELAAATGGYLAGWGAAGAACAEDADILVLDDKLPGWRAAAARQRALRGRGAVLLQAPFTDAAASGNAGVFAVRKPMEAAALLRAAAAAAGREAPVPEAAQPADAPAPVRGARVLLADDHIVNRQLLRVWLEELGCDVAVAEDGLRAVEVFQPGRFDAVFMDYEMPRLDGFGATAAIRKAESGAGRVPIIALTASSGMDGRRRCIEAGMDDYLQKPVRREDLAETLSRWIPLAVPAAQGPAWREECQRELLEGFDADSPETALAMEKALTAGDAAELGRLAHYLRGAALQAGLGEIGSLCVAIEKRCKARGLEGNAEDVARVAAAVAKRGKGGAS